MLIFTVVLYLELWYTLLMGPRLLLATLACVGEVTSTRVNTLSICLGSYDPVVQPLVVIIHGPHFIRLQNDKNGKES